jgi:hypothetical protein
MEKESEKVKPWWNPESFTPLYPVVLRYQSVNTSTMEMNAGHFSHNSAKFRIAGFEDFVLWYYKK